VAHQGPARQPTHLAHELERVGDFSPVEEWRGRIADDLRSLVDSPRRRRKGNSHAIWRQSHSNPKNRFPPPPAFMQDIWKPNNAGDDITGVNNFREAYTWHSNYWNFSDRVDYNITSKWRVFGRYSQFKNRIDESHTVQTRAMPKDEGGNMFSISTAGDAIYIINANTVFDISGSYASIQDDYACPSCELKDADLAKFWPNKWFTPYTKDLPVMYYPNLNVGDAYFGHREFWIEHPKNSSLHAKIVQTRGRHNLKVGFAYRRNLGLHQLSGSHDVQFRRSAYLRHVRQFGHRAQWRSLRDVPAGSGLKRFAEPVYCAVRSARQHLRAILSGRLQAEPQDHAEPRPAV
jgi:hypothetical protein